jgi:hypothetical protein
MLAEQTNDFLVAPFALELQHSRAADLVVSTGWQGQRGRSTQPIVQAVRFFQLWRRPPARLGLLFVLLSLILSVHYRVSFYADY